MVPVKSETQLVHNEHTVGILPEIRLCGMQRSINLSLSFGATAALVLSNVPLLPAAAQDADTAEDLGGVMSISLKDVVKPTIDFQGALQGGHQAGIGGFLPFSWREQPGSLMRWSTSISLIAMVRAASSTPMWMVARLGLPLAER